MPNQFILFKHNRSVQFLIMKRFLFIIILFDYHLNSSSSPTNDTFTISNMLTETNWASKQCPCRCIFDFAGQKTIICDQKRYSSLPTYLDNEVEIFMLNGKKRTPNTIAMSLIFQRKNNLKHLQLIHNNIPRIGSKAFGGSKNLRIIDLRHNQISTLEVDEFLDLDNLQELYLGHNQLNVLISGVFTHLKSLIHLDLSYNFLKELDSTIFLNLRNLKYLDLSGNAIKYIFANTFKTLPKLKRLKLADCKLKEWHSLAIDGLSDLEQLDLSSNLFERIYEQEFKSARSLQTLDLSSNQISVLEANSFSGHQKLKINLSHNRIVELKRCSFCNSSIEGLDLSSNRLQAIKSDNFSPISESLKSLNLSFNKKLNQHNLAFSLQSLKNLITCNISNMDLDDRFRFNIAFAGSKYSLNQIDLSFNHFTNLSGNTFPPLFRLEYLDLSQNRIESLDSNATASLARLASLSSNFKHLRLSDNAFNCRVCELYHFWSWIKTNPAPFSHNCRTPDAGDCLVCRWPNYMRGQRIDTLDEDMLPSCDLAAEQAHQYTAGSRMTLVIGLFSLSLVVILLVLVLIRKRCLGSIYYTNEMSKKASAEDKVKTIEAEIPIATIASVSNNNSIRSLPDTSRFAGDVSLDDPLRLNIMQPPNCEPACTDQASDPVLNHVDNIQWQYADEMPYNELSAIHLKQLEDDHLNNELQMGNDSLTMPSSMTIFETYVKCSDIDAINEAPFSSYEMPDDFDQNIAKNNNDQHFNSFLV